eukprot:NODE_2074_length_994_cov_70.953439_g1695_i0.p1 GENE.NODE_2074_length_994_cov_70.953439_g1695_i0~~NODE_2074_length_994_cov_70.953439_g1695_i0.p1  ORF type:complete len:80 (-),score=8.92 NODE_2074_length_994_cov_70.953439_g1695_i0:657-896(-)
MRSGKWGLQKKGLERVSESESEKGLVGGWGAPCRHRLTMDFMLLETPESATVDEVERALQAIPGYTSPVPAFPLLCMGA